MSAALEVVKVVSDAVILSYLRTFDHLVIRLQLWDEEEATLIGAGVGRLEDTGTWECDGVVRLTDLDEPGRCGFAILDTDANQTLRFVASSLIFVAPNGQEEILVKA